MLSWYIFMRCDEQKIPHDELEEWSSHELLSSVDYWYRNAKMRQYLQSGMNHHQPMAEEPMKPVLRSHLEPPLLGWSRSRSRFFIWRQPSAGAAFLKAAPAPTAFFWQAKKESLVLLQNMT